MNIIQARDIGFLVSEPGLAEVEPDLPTRRVVEFVDPFSGFDVKRA